ncbi:MAG: acyl carrier protein [Clostridia bacterium]|nr:acyl carrier protein [Clostridia bacterium]
MTELEVKEKVKKIVEKNAVANMSEVREDSCIKDVHGIDSIKLVGLVGDIEEEFEIEVKSTELNRENFANVGIITDFVMKRLPQ